ncbi:MAG: glycoside hydrolase family 127 protein [Armatimonadetes bacterium]|nr:glycoside hydrolase family 127 protein [Armatimonadota bacterium]
MRLLILSASLLVAVSCVRADVYVVNEPPVDGASNLYVFNRPPLLANAFAKLPTGAIKPRGWLRGQLELMANGMTGHLDEGLSPWLTKESGWWNGTGPGWEEVSYWVKGLTSLAYVLDDPQLKVKARRWLDAVRFHQQPDGYFGPQENKTKKDLWPNMPMLFAFQTSYEATGDKRVLDVMRRYFEFESKVPESDFLSGSWQKIRGGDNLESVYWLYNRTGESWLLDLAKRIHEHTSDWITDIPGFGYHGVNFAQGFREPAVYYQQSHDTTHLAAVERNYNKLMSEFGQMPGGMYAADENCRPGKTGAQQGAETCAMVEAMYSNESLIRITGDPKYADRLEEIAFNSFPAALTPDLKGLRYVTAPNLVQSDAGLKHCFEYDAPMLLYTPGPAQRCCQHNVGQGWPYYSEHLWLATRGNGLAAILYCACEVTARVGDSTPITIIEDTDYPFDEDVKLTFRTPKDVEFPIMLRIPSWCDNAEVYINGSRANVKARPRSYVVVKRVWSDGDHVILRLPMKYKLTAWEKQGNAVSLSRGPLFYSLKIGEKWVNSGNDKWPNREIFPTTPWNYCLVLNEANPVYSFKVKRRQAVTAQPFSPETAPITLSAKARKVPGWDIVDNCVGPVPPSPVLTTEPITEVELIPMGAARLRISVFPVAK